MPGDRKLAVTASPDVMTAASADRFPAEGLKLVLQIATLHVEYTRIRVNVKGLYHALENRSIFASRGSDLDSARRPGAGVQNRRREFRPGFSP
jgi:hypothetical protein